MLDAEDVQGSLHRLAEHFETAVQTPDEPAADGVAWGQFLDVAKEYSQCGPYGTAAGVLVLASAHRGATRIVDRAVRNVHAWWRLDEDRYAKYHVQTIRLAVTSLALRLAGERSDSSRALETALLARRLPSGLWGNYWIDGDLQDPTPRVVPSAMAVLGLALRRRIDDGPLPDDFAATVSALAELAQATKRPGPLEAGVVVAALVASGLALPGSFPELASRLPLDAAELLERSEVYFFDYEYWNEGRSARLFGRDYFIGIPGLFAWIAGSSPLAPGSLRALADDLTERTVEKLEANGGLFRTSAGQRFASVDQAWVATCLAGAADRANPPLTGRVWYALGRQRDDNVLTRYVLPLVSLFVALFANAVVEDASPITRTVVSAGGLMVGAIYGDDFLKRLLRRER